MRVSVRLCRTLIGPSRMPLENRESEKSVEQSEWEREWRREEEKEGGVIEREREIPVRQSTYGCRLA